MQDQDRENIGEEASGEVAEGGQEMESEMDAAKTGGPLGADPPIIVDGGGRE